MKHETWDDEALAFERECDELRAEIERTTDWAGERAKTLREVGVSPVELHDREPFADGQRLGRSMLDGTLYDRLAARELALIIERGQKQRRYAATLRRGGRSVEDGS